MDGCPFNPEEIPARAEIILSAIESASLGNITAPRDHGLEPILAVHDPDFVSDCTQPSQIMLPILGNPKPVLPHAFPVRRARQKPNSFLGQRGYYAYGAGTPILEGTW
ncbi:MAG: histone deacetylase family protein, partial [Chloroflexi bacterium]|nr:histone deacetylase family protein [Chloroflexota bacterium]